MENCIKVFVQQQIQKNTFEVSSSWQINFSQIALVKITSESYRKMLVEDYAETLAGISVQTFELIDTLFGYRQVRKIIDSVSLSDTQMNINKDICVSLEEFKFQFEVIMKTWLCRHYCDVHDPIIFEWDMRNEQSQVYVSRSLENVPVCFN